MTRINQTDFPLLHEDYGTNELRFALAIKDAGGIAGGGGGGGGGGLSQGSLSNCSPRTTRLSVGA